jgi:hypothetical protein
MEVGRVLFEYLKAGEGKNEVSFVYRKRGLLHKYMLLCGIQCTGNSSACRWWQMSSLVPT